MTGQSLRAAFYLFHIQMKDTVQIARDFGVTEATIANAFAQNSVRRREFLRERRGGYGR